GDICRVIWGALMGLSGPRAALGADNPQSRQLRRLLSARRERPRRCRTAEQRDELAAAAHSITSSARPSRASGNVRPSVLAVLRFMTSSIFVACTTGKSAGFAPLSTRAV